MAESNHDDLADALARMAEGESAPEVQPAPSPKPAARPVVKPAVKPAAKAVRPASARPAAPGAAAAGAPKTAPPVKAPAPPATPSPARAPRPAAPAVAGTSPPAPVIRPVAPVVRKARPTAPTVAAPAAPLPVVEIDQPSEADENTIIDDDDTMNIPAPDPSVLMYRSPKKSDEMRARKAAKKSLFIRRTLIPILFTCSMLLTAAACVKFFIGPDSTLRSDIPAWLAPTFIGIAIVLLVLAIVNMISVQKQAPLLKK